MISHKAHDDIVVDFLLPPAVVNHSHSCFGKTFNGQSYSSCSSFPYPNATLFWNFFRSNNTLDVARGGKKNSTPSNSCISLMLPLMLLRHFNKGQKNLIPSARSYIQFSKRKMGNERVSHLLTHASFPAHQPKYTTRMKILKNPSCYQSIQLKQVLNAK